MIRSNKASLELIGTEDALIRAARRAAETARQHGQPLLLWRDGQIHRVMPDDLPPLPDEAPDPTDDHR